MLTAAVAACSVPVHAQTQPTPPTAPVAATATATAPAPPETVEEDLQRLRDQIYDESLKQDHRDEAARRLASRGTPAAKDILLEAMISAGNPGAQLAAARAVPHLSQLDDRFVVPLFALFGKSRPLSDAAGQALGLFHGNADVLNRLLELAQGAPAEMTRIGAIRGLGSLVDKRAASGLVRIVADPDEPTAIRNAAADALVTLTGEQAFGRNAALWRQWWSQASLMSDDQWRQMLLTSRAQRMDRLQRRHDQLTDDAVAIFAEQYRTTQDEARAALALRFLQSNSPDLRAVAARWVYDDVFNNRAVSPAVRQQLRSMIGDSDPRVRAEVARTLWATVDPQALQPLLVQLRQEPSPAVRAQIAQTLAKIGDLRAISDLRTLLSDPFPEVVEAAAGALADFGEPLRSQQPRTAQAVAIQLRNMLDNGSAPPDQPRLRSAIVEAMVAMREPDVRQTLLQLLGAHESTVVRRTVLRGMGELRDSAYADVILDRLVNDPDDTIRLEAARALTYTALPDHAISLYPRLEPETEPNGDIREAVWRVLQTLFPQMNDAQLRNAVGRFAREPQRQVFPQQALRDLLIASGRETDLAYARQKLGEIYMNLGQPERAVAEFQAALDFWATQGRGMESETLMRQLLQARLSARQYREAARFGASLLENDTGKQELVGPLIRDEADRLVSAGRHRDALALITEAEQMKPPLASRYLTALGIFKAQAEQQLQEQ